MSFTYDLQDSQKQENELAAIFKQAGYTVTTTQSKGNYSDYDLQVRYENSSTPSYIELKYDKMAATTKNVAVELYKTISNRQFSSGISATKADWIVYKFTDKQHFYGIQTEDLKKLIDDKKYKRLVTGGDGKRCTLALFDRNLFIKNCEIVSYETLK